MYGQDQLDLTSSDGQYTFTLSLPTGAYTIMATSATTKPIIVPFMLIAGKAANIAIGAFELAQTSFNDSLTTNPADLNHDGVVNTLDVQLLFEQYGK
jgi:hypothetical protein